MLRESQRWGPGSVRRLRAVSPTFILVRCARGFPCSLFAGSVPSELAQPVIVDPEVVGDLMHHRDGHLVQGPPHASAHAQCRTPEEGDPVWEGTCSPAAIAFGQSVACCHTGQAALDHPEVVPPSRLRTADKEVPDPIPGCLGPRRLCRDGVNGCFLLNCSPQALPGRRLVQACGA